MPRLLLTRLLSLSTISQALAQHVSYSNSHGRPTCTVHSGNANTTDDVPAIIEAFDSCGQKGDIVFIANTTYHINSRLNPVVNDVNIDWQGQWLVSQPVQVQLRSSSHED
jgi:galacturan 1,4-alpha-galacturonidase